jgi:hypothetical protein
MGKRNGKAHAAAPPLPRDAQGMAVRRRLRLVVLSPVRR